MEKLSGFLTGIGALSADLSGGESLAGGLSMPKAVSVEEYSGPYEFAPGPDAQIVAIANKKATADITINPIPSNYGLITWNGSTLTVS